MDYYYKNGEPTPEAKALFYELKRLGIPAELEKYDGYKTIDIAITSAMVNIEVDGNQHSCNATQALVDLQRTVYSMKKGFVTLRIPNCLIQDNLIETASYIKQFIKDSKNQLY